MVQDVPDVGRGLFVVTVMQSNPTAQVRSGLLLLLSAAVLLVQISRVVPSVMPHESFQLPVVEICFPVGCRVGSLDLDITGVTADVLPRPVVMLRWSVVIPVRWGKRSVIYTRFIDCNFNQKRCDT